MSPPADQLPVVAIVGRPNVGKSSLFNGLTRTRDALVADFPGVTRDRIFGRARFDERDVMLVDTGGLEEAEGEIGQGAQKQTWLAIEEADLVLLVTDARDGLMGDDHEIARRLRKQGRQVLHVVNKVDGLEPDVAVGEASALGFRPICPVSATHKRGLEQLGDQIISALPAASAPVEEDDGVIRLALLGRPNAGKSTLLNRLLGEERALATPLPGTTRDPIHARLERDGHLFEVVDTAGIRRRRGSQQGVERFSTLKALQAVERAHVVIMLIDAIEGVAEQDARLIGHVIEAGRPLVIALNKWDGPDEVARQRVLQAASDQLGFALFSPVVVLSALHGSGLGELFDAIIHVHRAATQSLSTPRLTRALRDAVAAHAPASSRTGAPKLRYAHAGGQFPTRIIIHGTRTRQIKDSYRRYLINAFRKQFELTGVPVQLLFKDQDNPYAERKRSGKVIKRKR